MNIEELFDNEIYHNYGMLTTEDANLLTNYLKEEVMEYVDGLQKQIERIAELETAKDNYKQMVVEQKQRIAELECAIKSYAQVVDEIHTACDAAGCMIGIKYSEFISSQAAHINELDEALRALACEYEYQVCADEHYDKAMAVANSTGKDS